MSKVLENLVWKELNGPRDWSIDLDKAPQIAKEIEETLNDNEIYLGDIYGDEFGYFCSIYVETLDETSYLVPGPHDGSIANLKEFCNALIRLGKSNADAFPYAENAVKEISTIFQSYEQ